MLSLSAYEDHHFTAVKKVKPCSLHVKPRVGYQTTRISHTFLIIHK